MSALLTLLAVLPAQASVVGIQPSGLTPVAICGPDAAGRYWVAHVVTPEGAVTLVYPPEVSVGWLDVLVIVGGVLQPYTSFSVQDYVTPFVSCVVVDGRALLVISPGRGSTS